ncbi:MAG: carboxypeptidase regulatory-like domain-containing protein [Deltaproteobacteria bacterium]|nr:carboxypeptidase regulatory-like domain-containing protein [Deltaproteobacteria bacterium]
MSVALAVACMAGTAHAQQAPNDEFGIERFRLAMDGSGILDVDSATIPGHGSWGLGVWTGFAHSPLALYDPAMEQAGALVGQRITTGLVGTISLWNRIQLGVAVNAVDYQASTGNVDAVAGADSLQSAGLGDLRVAPKLLLLGGPLERFHVSIILGATIPLGAPGGYLRESGPTFMPELAVSWGGDLLRLAGNAGYRLRQKVTVADLVVDDEVFARAGLALRLAGTRDDVGTEIGASASVATALDPKANATAAEVMLGGSQRISRSTRLFAAGGIGLQKGFGTPDWRAVLGIRVQGIRGDRDGDLLADRDDRCPDVPEDRDGFEDRDGCSDPDNDGDGIADAEDKCATNAEDKDGFEDVDGCPDLDNDKDGLADDSDKCPDQPEDKDADRDDDGCPDPDGKVAGRVVDAEQQPIPAATVVIEQLDRTDRKPIELTVADNGTFSIDVSAGAVKVSARAAGFQPGDATLKVADGEPAPVVIALVRIVRQGQLRGQILSFNGKPLAATLSIVVGAGSRKATADADGFFSIDLPEGTFQVVIESPGHVTQRRSTSVKIERVTVMNVDMRRGR